MFEKEIDIGNVDNSRIRKNRKRIGKILYVTKYLIWCDFKDKIVTATNVTSLVANIKKIIE